eukprot:TRINITY_DN9104_c0_g1_i1.p1 TRINITY_DN9104_c0_g1~~TRINITY_DN9104_c0_g1_i1.p1  ORF type:complete len:151 (-),score=28.95 TRINITY_DN9104_c0_g1_i1:31-483(-)
MNEVPGIEIIPQKKNEFHEEYTQTLKPTVLCDETRLYMLLPDFGERVNYKFLFSETYIGVNLQIDAFPEDNEEMVAMGFPESTRVSFAPVYFKYTFGPDIRIIAQDVPIKRTKSGLFIATPLLIQKKSDPHSTQQTQLLHQSQAMSHHLL